jgi:hypothetical protein
MNSSTKLSDRVWNWLAGKVLPDTALQGLCREDFDEETFGASRVEWPVKHDEVERRTLSPAAQPGA